MTQDEINRASWENDENWTSGPKWLSVYFSHADSRVWVPKRIPSMGWTLNLAKPGGVWWLIVFLIGTPSVIVLLSVLIVSTWVGR